MLEPSWSPFVIYVNAYYAVQEAYDSARRNWEPPATGLQAFCKDANPFVWDREGSADPSLYEGFLSRFTKQFSTGDCTSNDGLSFVREWLHALEGTTYGTSLVSSLDAITNSRAWARACEQIERQLASRAARLEFTPQDEPLPQVATAPRTPTPADVDAVIALLANGDDDFAAELRARLEANTVE